MITMYDSTTPREIPTDAPIVAGYVDGMYAWSNADWERFPNATRLHITISPTGQADIYDCEPGNRSPNDNSWPGATAAWVASRIADGHPFPVVYCDRFDHPTIYNACTKAGIPESAYGFWVAAPHTEPHQIPGAIAVQYAWAADPAAGGRNVDVSCVYAGPWISAPVPTPNPTTVVTVPPFPGYISYGVGMPPHPPSNAVKAFQARLQVHGFYPGVEDGRDGPVTTDTLKRFQAHVDIATDGIGGPITWEKLWA